MNAMEDVDGTANTELQVLQPCVFTRSDLQRAYFWQSSMTMANGLHYDFGVPWPQEFEYGCAQEMPLAITHFLRDRKFWVSVAERGLR